MLDLILLDISNGLKTGIFIVAIIVVFYFFLIRPQSQKAKEEEAYRKSLKKGDRVMTAGGIHGTIVSTTDRYAMLEIAPGYQMKVTLTTLQPLPEPKTK